MVIITLINKYSYAQYDQFYIGMGVYDFDNISNTVTPGTDPLVGCDYEYLKGLSDYNFNLIIPYHQLMKNPTKWASDSPSKSFLDRANSLGIKVILNCPGISIWRGNDTPTFNQTNCTNALEYYGTHPAVLGWHIVDEPSENAHFSTAKQYADAIEAYNPSKLRFSNLFPNYATRNQLQVNDEYTGPVCSVSKYEDYIENFIIQTNPNFLSVDHYPMSGTSLYFYNLDIVARKAIEYNIPYFVMYTPTVTVSSNIGKNENEFNYVIFANLVYGTKGIFYWARERQTGCGNGYSSNCSSSTIIGSDRWNSIVSTSTKDYLKGLHKKILSAGNVLFSLRLRSVYHVTPTTGLNAGQIEQLPPTSWWSGFENDTYAKEIFYIRNPIQALSGSKTENIVISFLTDDFNNRYFWIFNKSITDDEYIKMNFKENTALINILDNKIYQESRSRIVYLEPGEAKLFKININYQFTVSICNSNYYPGSYSDIWAENIYIGGSSCNVKYHNGSKINYYAGKISIGSGVKIYEGSKVSFNSATMGYGTLKNTDNDEELTTITKNKEVVHKITIFPNPSLGQLTIMTTNKDCKIYSIEIYNLMGMKVVEMNNLNSSTIDTDVSLSSGIYFIKVGSNEGFQIEKLVIK